MGGLLFCPFLCLIVCLFVCLFVCGFLVRCGGAVSALDFQSGGRWFEPSLCRRVVSLDNKLHFTLSLFTQVNKCVPAIIVLGGNLAMD